MKYSEENLRSYVEKCFRDAFKAEDRDYDNKAWSFEWVMVVNGSGVYQMYPIVKCKFDRVLRRVSYRLQNNLMKNYGIHYGNTDEMRCMFYESGQIDFNYTQAMFKTKSGNISLSVIDEKTNPFVNGLSGECMTAYRFEKLLFKYYGLDKDSYNSLPEDDERRYLPDFMNKDWKAFSALYQNTFGTPLDNYEIICSSGVEQLK